MVQLKMMSLEEISFFIQILPVLLIIKTVPPALPVINIIPNRIGHLPL